MTLIDSSPTAPSCPSCRLDPVEDLIRTAVEALPDITAAELLQVCHGDYSPEELLTITLALLAAQADRVLALETTIDDAGWVIAAWAAAMGLSEEAVDDLNARLAANSEG